MYNNIGISWIDYPDNESLAIIMYFNGCSLNCLSCQNKELQVDTRDHLYYSDFLETMDFLLEENKTNKIVLTGGDPCYIDNIKLTKQIIEKFKDKNDMCIYTGYDIEYIKENNIIGFKYIKCGKYDRDKKQASEKTNEYIQFASSNQKLYNSKYELISNNEGRYYFKGE